MAKGTLKKAWGDYREAAIPNNAGAVQRSETEKAFYAGAFALCILMVEAGNEVTAEITETVVLGLEKEVNNFVDSLIGESEEK